MSLLNDFQDSFGGPRVARIPEFATDHLVSDLDTAGFNILGLDISALSFGVQTRNKVLAGPPSGSAAIPTFRVLTSSEVGAQTADDALTELSGLDPTEGGKQLLTVATPADISTLQIGPGGNIRKRTASQLADDLEEFLANDIPVMFVTDIPDEYTLTINGNLRLYGDAYFADAFSVGEHSVIFNTTGPTVLTLPELGTLATVAGNEILSNKELSEPEIDTVTASLVNNRLLSLVGLDIQIGDSDVEANDDPPSTDAWFNVNHCYFGVPINRTVSGAGVGFPAPPASVLGYFARSGGGLADVSLDKWLNDAVGPTLHLRKFRGTPNSPAAVTTNDVLGNILFEGYSTGQFPGAKILATAAQGWTGSLRGTTLAIQTVANGATSLGSRLTFSNTGAATFSGDMTVVGATTLGALMHITPVIFSALDSTPLFGDVQAVSDSGQNTLGSAVTSGGSSNKVMVWYNGTAWVCFAK